MEFKKTTKTFSSKVEQDQFQFMEKIIVKSSYPGALKIYNFVRNINIL